ncbi:MAG TPA: hypothetical protein VMG35_19690 [Bryobacteraceae bacterium]|nr:hypothetical protein [Bryobacteraceae bacterium]
MNLEDELRTALRRRDPSPDFAARVLARVQAEPVRRASGAWRRWVAAVAACLMLTVGAAGGYRYYEGQRAKAQVMLAMRIAAGKLNKAHKKVQMLNHRSNS